MNIEIKLAHGPVYMRWLKGEGLDNEYPLWESIYGHEYFPKNVESANYVLTLRKNAKQHTEVRSIEHELVDALKKLSEAWVFSGGSLFPIAEKKAVALPLYTSNAKEIEEKLLAEERLTKVVSEDRFSIEIGCTYYDAPLKNAINICSAAFLTPEIQNLVRYYTEARLDNEKWFIQLHKVRESLKNIYGSDKEAINALGLDKDDWSFFGKVLNNNDLRHPPKGKITVASVSRDDKAKVEALARKWVLIYLEKINVIQCKYPI
ncbi:MAG: hypothetical protein ACU836_17635 [Gammaproteobacteria bacterium]